MQKLSTNVRNRKSRSHPQCQKQNRHTVHSIFREKRKTDHSKENIPIFRC